MAGKGRHAAKSEGLLEKLKLDKKTAIYIAAAAGMLVLAAVVAISVFGPKETPTEPEEPIEQKETEQVKEPETKPVEPEKQEEPSKEPVSYTILFVSDGRTVLTVKADENASFHIDIEPDEMENKEFTGWRGTDGNLYQKGDTISISSDLSFTAEWQEKEIPEQQPEPVGFRNPLTGEPMEQDESSVRPFAVMINNISKATPQEGVSEADILFETLVEGGITRMLGIYHDLSVVKDVGSVRSARAYYLDIAEAYDAIYIHAGGSPEAYSLLRSRNLDRVDGLQHDGTLFYRDKVRQQTMGGEHSLMLNTEKFLAYMDESSMRRTHPEGYSNGMAFTDEPSFTGSKAEKVTLKYSESKKTWFDYNAEEKLYYVSQHRGAMMDNLTETQVKVKNIVAIYTNISVIRGDTAGRLRVTLSTSGSGYFVCEGKYTEINWSKASDSDTFHFTYSDGTPLEFGVGQSYIGILPVSGGNVTFE